MKKNSKIAKLKNSNKKISIDIYVDKENRCVWCPMDGILEVLTEFVSTSIPQVELYGSRKKLFKELVTKLKKKEFLINGSSRINDLASHLNRVCIVYSEKSKGRVVKRESLAAELYKINEKIDNEISDQ